MVYVDSKGITHVSLKEAKSGHAAQTTATRDATGAIVGDSIGSRYVREQEAKKEAEKKAKNKQGNNKITSQAPGSSVIQQQQPQPQQQQRGFLISPLNFIMPKAAAAPQIQQPEAPGFFDRIKNAWTQGYAAGEGKEYNLEGLTKPKTQAKDFYSYSLYEKAENAAKKYDAYQNSVLSGLPSGSIKGFVTGVTNVPEILITTGGSIPLGLESMARNAKSSPETISLGLGTMAGATVNKARNNPAELAGELIGTYGAGKVAGKAFEKVTPKEIKEVPIIQTERQFSVLEGVEKTKIETLGEPREYVKIKTRVAGENELNPQVLKNSKNVINQDTRKFNVNYQETISKTNSDLLTEIKTREGSGTLTLKRPKIINSEQKTFSGDSILKFDKKKWEAELSGLPDKYSYKKQYGIEQYFGKETFDYDYATVVKSQRIRPLNEIFPEKISKNSLPKNADIYFDVPKSPKQITFEDFPGEITELPKAKQKKPGLYFTNLKLMDKPKSQTAIPEIEVIPGKPKSELDFWKRDIILEELQPKTTTYIKTFEIPRTASKLWAWGGLSFAFSQPTLNGLGQQVKTNNVLKNDLFTLNENDLGIINNEKQDIIIPVKIENKPFIDPFIESKNEPVIDPILNPSIDPMYNRTFTEFKFPVMGGGWDVSRALNVSPRSRRKTKAKTIKNAWGDPLNIKIDIKF